jgi:hypothetical protein
MIRTHRALATATLSVLLIVVLSLPALAEGVPEIPSGTAVKVRIIDKLSSEESETADTFHGTLDEPIVVNGKELYPKGADVTGRVTNVQRSGRLSEPGELDLVLVTVSGGRMAASLSVEPLVIKGESHAKSNATKIGGGAALGAIIGAVAGGGKGAAIGAGVGAAAGTGAAAATGKRPAVVEPEAVLTFITASSSGLASETAASQTANPPANQSSTQTPEQNATPPASANPPEDSTPLFTLRDRRIIRNCVSEHAADFPPGTTERPELPAGSERHIRRGDTLSIEVQKEAQSLPLACVEQLPKLPNDLDRVVYNGRVLLIDSQNHILDMFYLDENH